MTSRRRTLVIAIIVIAVLLAVVLLFFQVPAVGVADVGDWGDVTDERTEVLTTLWVDNPNPVGIALGGSAEVSYDLVLNGVHLADGRTQGIDVPPGNHTVTLSTDIHNRRLSRWWVNFVHNNETIPLRVETAATVTVGFVSASPELPTIERTLLDEATPITSGLSRMTAGLEGRHTINVSLEQSASAVGPGLLADAVQDRLLDRSTAAEDVTVGYDIRRGWATWGPVTENRTVVRLHLLVHNPSRVVRMPAEPDSVAVTVEANSLELFTARGDEATLQNPEDFSVAEAVDRRVLEPGETTEVVYAIEMDNDRIDDWFVSHVRREERTDFAFELRMAFRLRETTIHVPADGPSVYSCTLRTDILVDDRVRETTCLGSDTRPGENASETSADGEAGGADATRTPTVTTTDHDSVAGTATPTATSTAGEPPVARASATPTEGEAPLTVTFDAGESTDPDGDIVRYRWWFGDGTPPTEGRRVEHTFRTGGQYEVRLVVVDAQGHRETTHLTVTVDRRIG